MFEVGRLCVKLAGRDAGKKCVVIDVLDDSHVLIDGETRRRKCNLKHLDPLGESLDVKKGASRADVKKAFKGIGVELADSKPKKAGERPKKQKVKKSELGVPEGEAPKKAAPAKEKPAPEPESAEKAEESVSKASAKKE